MMLPKVSVIIPNFNYANFLRETVRSVLEQTYRNIEVIVIDDCSTDDSLSVLSQFPQVKVIQQERLGVSAARNKRVSISGGDFIAFLDADDIWLPEKVEKQVAKFRSDPELGLVYTGYEKVDLHGNSIQIVCRGLEGAIADQLLMFNEAISITAGSGAMIPRKVFDKVGGFDPRLSTSADFDLCYRILKHYRAGFVPEVLFKYRIHGVNMHANIKKMEHDMLLCFEKAFADGEQDTLKREAYAKLYRVLAGSYFYAKDYKNFLRNSVKCVWYNPAYLYHFVKSRFSKLGSSDQ